MKGAEPASLVIESRKKILEADEGQVPRHRKTELRAALEAFAGLLIKDAQLLENIVWEDAALLETLIKSAAVVPTLREFSSEVP